jgi:microcystin degradation protein MlrC
MYRRSFLKGASLTVLNAIDDSAQTPARDLRIAYGGIGIECSTYSRLRTRMNEFSILRDAELTSSERFQFLKRYPVTFLPTLLATAVPGGPVERKTYETIKGEFLKRLEALLPLHGLYLPMHGAMFVEGMQDAESDWYHAARKVVGPDCLLSASYDLHGNISQPIIDTLDMLSAFRTAPHIDREETMLRATDMLLHCLREKIRPTLLWAPIPVLMPGERSSTEWEPGKRLWAQLPALNREPGIVHRAGFSPEFEFGPCIPILLREDCVQRAIDAKTQPAILADSGDNPTGGGNGDQATVLESLLRHKAQNVVFAGITDRPATEACYKGGVGASIPLSIGATLDPKASQPVKTEAVVKFLLAETDPAHREAVVEIQGITLVLAAYRRPYHDIQDFTRLGLDPKSFKIVVVKSGYLSPELAPIANPSLMALSDGAINQDIVHLPANLYRRPSYPFVADLGFTPKVYGSARNRP